MHRWISQQKILGRSPAEFAEATTQGQIFREFQKLLKAMNACDFDDLITVSTHLLREQEAIRRSVRNRCQYMLVDEYQDSNPLQVGALGGSFDRPSPCSCLSKIANLLAWRAFT